MVRLFARGSASASPFASLFLALAAALTTISGPAARGVVARGIVTDALNRPIPAARVQLVEGKNVVASAITGSDGTYDIRYAGAGRFVLLTSAVSFYPGIGQEFYGGVADVLTRNLVLETASLHEEVTVATTGIATPVQQISDSVTLIPDRELATRVDIVDLLRLSPGVSVVQTGQYGGATSLFVRGGNSDANKVVIDGIPAEDVGGRFDFGTVSSSGIGPVPPSETAIELHRGPASSLFGTGAAAGVVIYATARGAGLSPVLNYFGEGGNLHTYRNEVSISGTRAKLDYFADYSRFNTSNALPLDEYHSGTASANLGYSLGANTSARLTIRNSESASGLPSAHDFFGVSAAGKQGDQDLYAGLTLNDQRDRGWHNELRYGIARKREHATIFYPAGDFVKAAGAYFGNTVTIRGANGYSATGRAILDYGFGQYPQPDDSVSNRDELYYQTDYLFPHRVLALFNFRYQNERGRFAYPTFGEDERIQRTNFEYTGQIAGDIKNRLFLSAGGAVEKNHLYGIAGTPRVGFVYVPVRPGSGWFHGTRVRANLATGVQEPSLSVDFSSLFTQLLLAGNTSAIRQYNVTPIRELRSRTGEVGLDQSIRGEKLILKLNYFHNQFSNQTEYVAAGTLKRYFGITGNIPNLYGAEVGSLAFRAQGTETELDWRPTPRWSVRGAWTYLDAVVEQSFSTDQIAIQGGYAAQNPDIPGISIGESPFVGARPFRRPPHTGFFAVEYGGRKFAGAVDGALASRSDDSTFLDYADLAGTNSLILPNRNLDFGFVKIDSGFTYAVRRQLVIYGELDNLLNNQHIGPIGYPGLPLTVRAGVKVRLGRD